MALVDFHCHSSASDGLLSPVQLVRRAHANGVNALALTDHDEIRGLDEAEQTARDLGMRFVPGVEISVTWAEVDIHIIGLGFDRNDVVLGRGLAHVRAGRTRRAHRMAAALEARGVPGTLQGAISLAGNPEVVGRAHFARYLAARGYGRDAKSVFQHYLACGRPGHVPHRWAELSEAVGWIRGAGGIAVLAHPQRYKLARGEFRRFLGEFVDAGGRGIEVAAGDRLPAQSAGLSAIARRFGLLASLGSDFHGPDEGHGAPGVPPRLAAGLTAVWTAI